MKTIGYNGVHYIFSNTPKSSSKLMSYCYSAMVRAAQVVSCWSRRPWPWPWSHRWWRARRTGQGPARDRPATGQRHERVGKFIGYKDHRNRIFKHHSLLLWNHSMIYIYLSCLSIFCMLTFCWNNHKFPPLWWRFLMWFSSCPAVQQWVRVCLPSQWV